jgi:serine protease Do
MLAIDSSNAAIERSRMTARSGSRRARLKVIETKMRQKKTLMNLGVAAAAVGLAGAGGFVARAAVAPGGGVNAQPAPSAGLGAPASFADIVQHVAPAVVSIEVEGRMGPQRIAQSGPGGQFGPQGPEGDDSDGDGDGARSAPVHGAGSGFFVSPDGYIVTNNHVVQGATKITVHTADDRNLNARVIGHDDATDLAVLKVDASGLPFVSFEDRGKPRVGDWVVAVGNPFNLGGTATAGIVSALGRRDVSGSSYVDFMQIDAPINRGNSGGPTFDLNGRVVGVNTAIFSPSGGSVGIGFDIPADVAASVSRELISSGKITRGYLGATVQDVTPEIADSLGIAKGGALVADVTPGGPASAAGIRSGDLILQFDGRPVATGADLTRQVGGVRAGDTIRLQVRREGQVREVAVRSGLRPSEVQLASNDRTPDGEGAGGRAGPAVLGLRVAPDSQGRGVRVAGVSASSDAAEKGLQPGDLIESAGQQQTRSPGDLVHAVAQARETGHKQVLLLVARGRQHIFVPVELGAG